MPDWKKNWTKNWMKNWMKNKETMLILFLSGILIFVILLPVDNNSKNNASNNNNSYQNRAETPVSQADTEENRMQTEAEMSLQEYKEMMEAELEEFLSGVSGVGEVKALIYMKASWEYQVEKDAMNREQTQNEETVYTVNEYGREVPFVKRYLCPQIDGVAVLAAGAANEEMRVRLVHLIMALYGLEANKVEVIH